MNTAAKLKLCNRALGITLIIMLASGIQLEVTSGRYTWTVWLHIILGVILTILSFGHIYLHYRRSNWFARFGRNPNTATRILWWTFLLTIVSGLAATAIWLVNGTHTPAGAVHGKLGFLMVLLAIIHHRHHGKPARKKS